MKKTIVMVVMLLCIFTVYNVEAKTVRPNDISPSTYVVGTHMYTRNTSSTTGYDGTLTTGRIMLGARTIIGDNINDMIIYYKNLSGKWIDALTGEDISNILPTSFEIESTDLTGGTGTITAPNFETYGVNNSSIGASTYVIGSYIFTRNVFSNENHENDGALTTREIMLAAKTIEGNSEADMKIYYKTISGKWINALTGVSSSPPTVIRVAVIDLINQQTEGMTVNLIDGNSFNTKIKALAGNSDITKIKKATSINLANMTEENIISTSDSEVPVYAWFDNGTIYYYPLNYIDNVKIYLNTRSNKMFYDLDKLTSIDLSGFDTSKVTNMSSMFSGCSSLTTLDLSTFDTSSLTNMRSMFAGCKKLTNINLSSFNTTNVNDMYRLFFNCEKLTTINLSNFVTNNVVEMKEMFAYCSSLTSLNLSSFNTSQVVSFEKMFQYCGSLTTITLDKTKFITTNSSSMSSMFQYCEKLESVDVSGFDTSNVYDLSYMFSDCQKLLHIDVSNFDTSNVTNMKYMFLNCTLVDELNVSNFDTSKVTDISWMFFDCAKLETLDLSSFDLSKVTDTTYMIHALHSLKTIKMPKVYPSEPIEIDKILDDQNGKLYENTTEGMPAEVLLYNSSYMLAGSTFNAKIKTIAENISVTNSSHKNTNVYMFKRETNVNNIPDGVIDNEDNIISSPESYYPVYAWYKNNIIYYYSESETIYLDADSREMFRGFTRITLIDLTGINTKRVTNMTAMFMDCNILRTVNLSGFDTSKVTSFESMFYNCWRLQTIDLSNFVINSTASTIAMFDFAEDLEEIVFPDIKGDAVIGINKDLYLDTDPNVFDGILGKNLPVGTILKDHPWSSIPKTNTTMSINPTSGNVAVNSSTSTTITTDGDGTISCESLNINIATCSVNENTVTINGVANGITTITIKQAEGQNYSAADDQVYTVTVGTPAYAELVDLELTPYGRVYSGISPDNYVWFNNEQWRIIGVYGENLKIIKATPSTVSQKWQNASNDGTVWSESIMQSTYLENTYYPTLSNDAKAMIQEDAQWAIASAYDSDNAKESYKNSSSHIWTDKIGLLAAYEYLYAAENDGICWEKDGYGFDDGCVVKDWLYNSITNNGVKFAWTLTPDKDSTTDILSVNSTGYIGGYDPTSSYAVSPVVYLKANVTITEGNGKIGEENSYKLSLSPTD